MTAQTCKHLSYHEHSSSPPPHINIKSCFWLHQIIELVSSALYTRIDSCFSNVLHRAGSFPHHQEMPNTEHLRASECKASALLWWKPLLKSVKRGRRIEPFSSQCSRSKTNIWLGLLPYSWLAALPSSHARSAEGKLIKEDFCLYLWAVPPSADWVAKFCISQATPTEELTHRFLNK